MTGASDADIESLHARCGIYTRDQVVREVLDAIKWCAQEDLTQARLLEPAAGNGAFLVEAARRLIQSFRRRRKRLTVHALRPRIISFELYKREADLARQRVTAVLRDSGVHPRTARACASSWIVTGDFLLNATLRADFTHSVGNPPYVRWSKIPSTIRSLYDANLPRCLTGGDLFLPFLDRTLNALATNGRIGFVCSDRWRYMAFARRFRETWLPMLDIEVERTLPSGSAFLRTVESYPSILIAKKRSGPKLSVANNLSTKQTLVEAGYSIRVGPALGVTPAFVLGPDEEDVEDLLLRSWIAANEVREGQIQWAGRRVVTMHNDDGTLVDLNRYPSLRARLERYRSKLASRYIVRHGSQWFEPIDRVRGIDWTRPKILVPELAKIPRCAIDTTGAIPSHGVYAIFAPRDKLEALYEELRDGGLASRLEQIAPRVGSGYFRCYARFLGAIPVSTSAI